MKQFIRENLAFSIAYLVFTAAAVALMTLSRILPFIDLPNHLAAATICRYIGEPGNLFSQYFETDLWLNSNIFHYLFLMFPLFPTVEFANHLFYAIYAVLLPLSVLLLIRRLGGNVWLTLPVFLLINNYSVMWGFSGYALAIPLLIFLFHLTIESQTNPSWLVRIGIAALLVFLFFVHAQVALFGIALFVVCGLYHHRGRLGPLGKEFSAIVPVAILFIAWWMLREGGSDTLDYFRRYYGHAYWATLGLRWKLVVFDNIFLFRTPLAYWVAGFFTLVMFSPLLVGLVVKRVRLSELKTHRYFPLAFILPVLALILFFALPQAIPRQPIVYERLSVFVMLGVIILGSLIFRRGVAAYTKVALTLIVVVYFILWADYYMQFNQENENLTEQIFPADASQNTMAGLVYDYEFRGHPICVHLPYYYTVWTRGVTPAAFVDYRFGVVSRKVDFDVLPLYLTWEWRAMRYDGRYSNMDYLLVRGKIPQHIYPRLREFKPVDTWGNWSLLENRLR
ncbi:MAG: hypothetical protein JSU74_09425 [Candidatus Zixiibacteriota bacterium]|nr:MAG: hypothetical protein JSU74_09425 [candidate division Zixibacteria bacterium]